MATKIHVGDIGTIFELTIVDENDTVIDLSTATTKDVLFRRPSQGKRDTHPTVFKTPPGTDGVLKYTGISGDIDVDGFWSLQVHVILPGADWYTEIIEFEVEKNL